MSEHTPGPWILDSGNGAIYAKRGASFDSENDLIERVATMRPTCVTDRWEADARLITAAPELLAAAQKAIAAEDYQRHGGNSITEKALLWAESIAMFRAAIDKAEGR